MKEERLGIRLSSRRMEKLRQYAAEKDKTITQVIEECVDKLKINNG